jgi:hypothetical protein
MLAFRLRTEAGNAEEVLAALFPKREAAASEVSPPWGARAVYEADEERPEAPLPEVNDLRLLVRSERYWLAAEVLRAPLAS